MVTPPEKRTGIERQRARERDAQEAEVARLTARVRELEQTNEALRSRVEELLRTETDLADPGTTAQVLVALVESLTHRLVGTTDADTLAREVTRAANAYLNAACASPRPVGASP